MLKIFRYLKSSFISVLAIILLLVVQAILDLTLPDYTSKIVNVGVQQGGIDSAAIEKIGEDSYKKLTLFLDSKELKYIQKNYQKKSSYKGENIYELKEHSDTDKISRILRKPMLIVYYMDHNDSTSTIQFDLPEKTDLYTALSYMNENQKEEMLKKIDEKLKDLPDTIIEQAAVNYVKEEYQRIGVNTDKIQNRYIIQVGILMLAISFATMIIGVFTVLIGSRMAARLSQLLRKKVFKKVVGFSKNEVKKFGQSSLITRTTNDIQQVQMVVVFLLRVVFYAPIIGIGGIMKALNTNSSMTYIIGIAVLTIILLVMLLFGVAMPKFKIIQKLVDKLNLVVREILTGLPVIRAFANEKHEEKRFDEANKNLTKVNLFVNRVMSFMMPAMMFIMNVICLLIVYKGAKGVDSGAMQVGDIMAYIQYTMQIIMAFLMISMMSIMLPRASVSAKRIIEVIETEDKIQNPKNPKEFENKKGIIEFKNVSFRYPDADYDVITDINFQAEPGKTTAFIGSTGSGKSTLINLLPRFYDVTGGEILIDGINIKDVAMDHLRDRIGFVPQKGVLFTGTIESNVKYGKEDISDEDMKLALDISQSSEFVDSLKGKYQYPISQGGSNVSGGQKQRLSIARAIAKKPDIYVFDDSFSALDFKTDAKLRKELKSVTKDKTVLIVAQRISTIMNADQIIVLDEGNIAGIGTHKELMKNCKVYQEIALSQLSKEEL